MPSSYCCFLARRYMPHKRSSNSWPSRWSCFSWLEHIYKHIVVKFIDLVAGFVGRVNYAKFKDLELQSIQRLEQLTQLEETTRTVAQDIILRGLSSDDLALLLAVNSVERMPITGNMAVKLGYLRDRGLVAHDEPRLRDSKHAWTTTFGKELTEVLTKTFLNSAPGIAQTGQTDGQRPSSKVGSEPSATS
jgi:hypothetical protein